MVHPKLIELFRKHAKPGSDPEACWIWPHSKKGTWYGVVQTFVKGKRVREFAHRISFELHHGHPSKHNVTHSCDNPACWNPNHLEDKTQSQNLKDMYARKRRILKTTADNRGERNGMHKLSKKQIAEIRRTPWHRHAAIELAARFEIHPAHIRAIHRQAAWKAAY